MNKIPQFCLSAIVLLFISACGGGGGGGSDNPPPSPPPPPPPIVTQAQAFQLLNQASFGATEAEAERVKTLGIEGWIDDQLQQAPSLQLPHVNNIPINSVNEAFLLNRDRVDIWFRNVINGDDQLRQRLAFALSEIMVVSQFGALVNYPWALSDYYDTLARNAFGNYRDLIEDVTLHPAMGIYLSMLGNEKPNAALNIRPDENYARELMQLFSIGLVELNLDGSEKLDINNQPIPTYDQAIIEGFAHVYTGWTFAGAIDFKQAFPTKTNQVMSMELYPGYHDNGEKQLLNNAIIPAGQTGEQDLANALDNIFNHPNVGPFIAIRLIQRLVTSNPSPAYVARVASVFNDNGSGVRGDLAAVAKAILIDPEARPETPSETSGKIKEPLLRLTQLWRAYDASSEDGTYLFDAANYFFGQGPLQSPSVFNFFSPFYAPAGEIRNGNLTAPELQIATEYQNTLVTNFFLFQSIALNSSAASPMSTDILIQVDEELALADDPEALVDRIAEKLLAGEISPTLRTETINMAELISTDNNLRVGDAIYFIASSPEFAYQK